MSRHRFVRGLDISEIDSPDPYEEDFVGSPVSPSQAQYLSRNDPRIAKIKEYEEKEQLELETLVDQIYDVVGDEYEYDYIVDALEANNRDVDKTVDWIYAQDEYDEDAQFDLEFEDEYSKLDKKGGGGGGAKSKQQPAKSSVPAKPAQQPSAKGASASNKQAATQPAAKGAANKGQQKVAATKSTPANPAAGTSTAAATKADTKSKASASGKGSASQKSAIAPSEPSTVGQSVGEVAAPSASPAPSGKDTQQNVAETEELKLKRSVKQMSAVRRAEVMVDIDRQQSNEEAKVQLNMIVIGHVDAGKSTMMGHLLFLLGQVDKKLMHKYQKESDLIGKGSFAYAWVMDQHEEERSRGVTIDVGVNFFETKTKIITLLDAPGHRDFVPNMIAGAAQAEVGVLVIDSNTGEFEMSFLNDGQTKEHTILARSLGVAELIVAVNKLELSGWSQSRFEFIVSTIKPFLKQVGYRESSVRFVPVSGLSGENLVTRSNATLGWYTGPSLVELIDTFKRPERQLDKPLRMSISDIYKSQSLGLTVAGKIETGIISVGDNVLISPSNEICAIKGIRVNEEQVQWAIAGDNPDIGISGVEANVISIGSYLCDPEHRIKQGNRITAQIVTFTVGIPIIKGHSVVFHTQSINEPGNVSRLISLLDKTTGEVKRKNPRSLGDSETAIIELTLAHSVPLELFSEFKQLGRFTLRREGRTIASGIVTSINQVKSARDESWHE